MIKSAMAELDVDGSGEVDFTEFSAWWQRWAQKRTSAKQRSGLDGVIAEIVADVASVRLANVAYQIDFIFVSPYASCRRWTKQQPQAAEPRLTNKSWN